MTDAERVERGRRAQLAYDEFVRPALDAMDEVYAARSKELALSEPWAADKTTALNMARGVVDMVTNAIKSQIIDGDVARRDIIRVEEINSMPAARRRALGL